MTQLNKTSFKRRHAIICRVWIWLVWITHGQGSRGAGAVLSAPCAPDMELVSVEHRPPVGFNHLIPDQTPVCADDSLETLLSELERYQRVICGPVAYISVLCDANAFNYIQGITAAKVSCYIVLTTKNSTTQMWSVVPSAKFINTPWRISRYHPVTTHVCYEQMCVKTHTKVCSWVLKKQVAVLLSFLTDNASDCLLFTVVVITIQKNRMKMLWNSD